MDAQHSTGPHRNVRQLIKARDKPPSVTLRSRQETETRAIWALTHILLEFLGTTTDSEGQHVETETALCSDKCVQLTLFPC